MELLTQKQVAEVNRMLAKEFIESHLDAEASEANIEVMVDCIDRLERY